MTTIGTVLLAIVIACSSLTSVRAQSTLPKAEHDSLWAVWIDPSHSGADRLAAMHTIAWKGYLYIHPDSAFHFAQLQFDLATSLDSKAQMANALNTQGHSFIVRGHYAKALGYYQKSLRIRDEIEDLGGISSSLSNIGLIYEHQGDHTKALAYYQRSLTASERIGDKRVSSVALGNIGNIHSSLGDQITAMVNYRRCLDIFTDMRDSIGIATSLQNIGNAYRLYGDKGKTLEYYEKSLQVRTLTGDKWGLASSHTIIGEHMNELKKHQHALDHCLAGLKLAEELAGVMDQKQACQCLYNAYKGLGRSSEALVLLERIGEFDKQLNKEETAKQLERMEFQQVMLQDSIIKAEEARLVREAHQEEVRRNTRTRNVLAVSGGFFVLLAGGFYSRARYMRRSRAVLQVEKDRSENLLLNILPAEIAEELKQNGRCEARDFDLVSILFTDFKGFTEHSASMSAAALVNEINHCFEAFDGIMAKYGIEKIKTIGDAYMAAGGLPVPTEGSVKNTVLAALEMQRFIRERKVQKDALGEPAFEMRVGIHTGPVVAGIVGVKKFQYDIWGDTVNTASRMESSGVVGRVNISEATYALVKDAIDPNGTSLFQFEARGNVSVKGKGELQMFFVQERETSLVDLEENAPTMI